MCCGSHFHCRRIFANIWFSQVWKHSSYTYAIPWCFKIWAWLRHEFLETAIPWWFTSKFWPRHELGMSLSFDCILLRKAMAGTSFHVRKAPCLIPQCLSPLCSLYKTLKITRTSPCLVVKKLWFSEGFLHFPMGLPMAFPCATTVGAQAVLPASACAPCRPRCNVWSQRCGSLSC